MTSKLDMVWKGRHLFYTLALPAILLGALAGSVATISCEVIETDSEGVGV